ncbi:uncharacterized protein FF36_01238 [Frankia torreyi]|uniref:SCP domain-containing protein n=1 Tax=Frankia torreyi TaxID=1856 RepID=A0A0D8BK39_9ACTN|nr:MULTISPECIES: CAP domain-containing protein [Frankia]KJE24506.1 uncharacterized protein FF36_01238 [Frankia torreyi]KQC38447.1 hypothetical protein UK82_10510 [Frankia sp. ACN1ag]KQM06374.1 hypothetical protein FF86_100999 [Frankia sp. CpI1-P]
MQRTRNRHRAPRRPVLPAYGAAAGVLLATLALALWVTGRAGAATGGLALRVAGATSAAERSSTGNPAGAAAGAATGQAGPGTVTAARTPARALAAPIGGAAGSPSAQRPGPGASGPAAAGAAGLAAPGQPPARARLIADVIAATNRARRAAGCADLVADPVLTAAARAHSVDMAVSGYFRHDSPDGRSPFDRMAAAGFDYSVAAENIAAGQRSAAEVVRDWMDSPEHRSNILTCSLTRIGVGLATGGTYGYYWTQDFATPETGP